MDISDEAELKQTDLEYRILNLDFNAKKFTELENLQITGRLQEVGRIVSKHLDNKHLIRYITRFRKQLVFFLFENISKTQPTQKFSSKCEILFFSKNFSDSK